MPDPQQITYSQAKEALKQLAAAGADEDQIKEEAEKLKPRLIPDPPPTLLEAERALWEKHPTAAGLARGATSTLPFAGAVSAGLLAPEAPIVAPAAGAAAGRGAQDLIDAALGLNPIQSPGNAAARMGVEGLTSAATGGALLGAANPRAAVGKIAGAVEDTIGSSLNNKIPLLRLAGPLRRWGANNLTDAEVAQRVRSGMSTSGGPQPESVTEPQPLTGTVPPRPSPSPSTVTGSPAAGPVAAPGPMAIPASEVQAMLERTRSMSGVPSGSTSPPVLRVASGQSTTPAQMRSELPTSAIAPRPPAVNPETPLTTEEVQRLLQENRLPFKSTSEVPSPPPSVTITAKPGEFVAPPQESIAPLGGRTVGENTTRRSEVGTVIPGYNADDVEVFMAAVKQGANAEEAAAQVLAARQRRQALHIGDYYAKKKVE